MKAMKEHNVESYSSLKNLFNYSKSLSVILCGLSTDFLAKDIAALILLS